MSSFLGEEVLSEVLGFAALWGATYWKRLPQLHLDDSLNTETIVLGSFQLRKSTILRLATAVFLVVFQVLLAGADASSRWVTPLITVGVYALTYLTNQFDLMSLQSYTLLSPTKWSTSKLDMRDPVVLPSISIATSMLLLWMDYKSALSATVSFSLLVSGIGFFAFMSRAARHSEDISEKTSPNNNQDFLRSVAAFACAFSLVLLILVASGMQHRYNVLVLFEIALRAVQAFGLIMYASENALAASSTVTVASIATAIIGNPNLFLGIKSLLAFSGSVAQLALTAPKSNDKRVLLFAFLFAPGLILSIMSDLSLAPSAVKEAVIDPLTSLPHTAFAEYHPVAKLHNKWTKQFEDKLARQSKNIQEAVDEYKQRYLRKPPPGFDKWFQFAQERNYSLPDEFDTLMESMEPFWQVTPSDLLARIQSAAKYGDNFAEIEIVDNKVGRRSWDHWYTNSFIEWFIKFGDLKVIPDFNFTMNAFDEPRTIFYPTGSIQNPTKRSDISLERRAPKDDKNNVTWVDMHQQPTWPEIAPFCPNQGLPEMDDGAAYTYSSYGIDFLDASGSQQDVCVSHSLRTDHGFYAAPESMKLTHDVVPIFSQAVPRPYNDIIYPTPFYYEGMVNIENDNKDDLPWEAKRNKTYWAGGSTGGHLTLDNWKHIHRNRIALMTSPKSTEQVTLLRRTKLGKWSTYQSLWGAISQLFTIKVTRLVQCEEDACQEMERKFDLGPQPGNSSLAYKYILDIDGNSYTGRYYGLLRSNGCVIKSTIFREWHDDILTPWVHYIPLSNGAKEFGEMMRFLITEPEGDFIGRRIALSGKEWAERSLRRDDMEVYAMRVFMEYGRLFDEERDKNGFEYEGV